jgi:hypothetical protein
MVDENYKIDIRPLNYTPPKTSVAHLVQQPSYLIDGYSLADAYMRDARAARKKETNT